MSSPKVELSTPLARPDIWTFELERDAHVVSYGVLALSWFAARQEAAVALQTEPDALRLAHSPLTGAAAP